MSILLQKFILKGYKIMTTKSNITKIRNVRPKKPKVNGGNTYVFIQDKIKFN